MALQLEERAGDPARPNRGVLFGTADSKGWKTFMGCLLSRRGNLVEVAAECGRQNPGEEGIAGQTEHEKVKPNDKNPGSRKVVFGDNRLSAFCFVIEVFKGTDP